MKWFGCFVFGIFSVIALLFLSSELLDPYGLKNTNGKRVENLNSEETFLYPLKIQPNSYYLVGTSRTLAFDIAQIEEKIGKKTYFLGISGSNINQWLFLIEKIKAKQSNIILGLDLFSLNQTQIKTNTKPQILLHNAFDNSNYFQNTFYFLNSNFIQTSFSTIFRNLFLPRDHLFTTQNLKTTQENFEIKKGPYKDFVLASNKFEKLLGFLSSQDIVIVFPEYWKYYKFYAQQKNQNNTPLIDEYMDIIKKISQETKAQIWVFGGINTITLNDENFDYDYWHFKPKVAEMIVNRIFGDNKQIYDFGFQLDRNQIDKQLSEWKMQIIQHQETK